MALSKIIVEKIKKKAPDPEYQSELIQMMDSVEAGHQLKRILDSIMAKIS